MIYSLHAEAFLVKLLGERKVEFCLLPHPRLALLLCCRIIPVIDVWKEQFSGNKKYIPVPPRAPWDHRRGLEPGRVWHNAWHKQDNAHTSSVWDAQE